jgi:hypothetical protein
MTNNH